MTVLLLGFGPTEALAVGPAGLAAPGVKTMVATAARERGKKCSERREEYQQKGTKFFGLPDGTELNEQATRLELTKTYCKKNLDSKVNNFKKVNGQGTCERTLMQIVNMMVQADMKVGEACVLTENLNELRACDQVDCKIKLSSALKQSSAKLAEASTLVKDGLKELQTLREQNEKVAMSYGNHLITIADVIREHDAQANLFAQAQFPPAQAHLFASLSEDRKKKLLLEKLGVSTLQVEGSADAEAVLTAYGLSLRSKPEEIEKRGTDIKKAAEAKEDLPMDGNFHNPYGHYAGEQIRMIRTAYDFEPLAAQTRQDLDSRVGWMTGAAARIDADIARAGTLPPADKDQPPATPANPPPGTVNTGVPPPTRVATGPGNVSGGSRMMGLAALGTGAAMANSMSQNEAPASAPARASAPRAADAMDANPAPVSTSRKEKTRSAKKDPATSETSNTAKASPDSDAMPAEDLGKLAAADEFTYAAGHTIYPTRSDRGGGEASARAPAARAADSDASYDGGGGLQLSGSRPAPAAAAEQIQEDPAMTAYVDRQMNRLESGGRKFSSNLRSQLREQLKQGYSLRKLAAEGAGERTGSGGAVAGLIQQLHESGAHPNEEVQVRRALLALAGPETDAEIRRMMGEVNPEDDTAYGILGSQSLSLFERVRSANQRFMATKATSR